MTATVTVCGPLLLPATSAYRGRGPSGQRHGQIFQADPWREPAGDLARRDCM